MNRIASRRSLLATGLAVVLSVGGFISPGYAGTPQVLSTLPAKQSVGVSLNSGVRIKFSENMKQGTINSDNIYLMSSQRGSVPVNVSYSPGTREAILAPVSPFVAGERIVVSVTKQVTDSQGNPLPNGYHFQFTTWTAPAADTGLFDADTTWATGAIAFYMTAGDLDGDDLPDPVFSNVVPNTITVLRADGGASFSPLTTLPTGIQPRHSVIGDLNRDGFSDVATCLAGTNEMAVFLNQGAGVLGAAVNYTAGFTPYGACLGDFDSDGDLDIANANLNGPNVTVLWNDGLGAFATVDTFAVGTALAPTWVDAADFDSDGDLDLACPNANSDDVAILINDGTGQFTFQPPLLPTQESPNFLETRDFNGDFLVDIVTVNGVDNSLTVFIGNGDGTFQPATHYPLGGSFPAGIFGTDIDGDFDLDVLVPVRGLNAWRIMENDGAGQFSQGDVFGGGLQCHSISAADWDQDGDIDVVSGFAQSIAMRYYQQATVPRATGTDPVSAEVAVAPDETLEVFFNTAMDPATVTPAAFRVEGELSGPHDFTTDWDDVQNRAEITLLDTFDPSEIVTVTLVDGALATSAGIPQSGLSFQFLTASTPAMVSFRTETIEVPGFDPNKMDAADFDQDSRTDLVVSAFLSGELLAIFGLTDGIAPGGTATSLPVPLGPVDLWTGDVTGDGLTDVVSVSIITPSLSVVPNVGGGSFDPAINTPLASPPFAVSGGDFDLDGDLDVVVTESSPNGLRVFWNDGSGGFPTSTTIPASDFVSDLTVADLSGDGFLDVAGALNDANQVEVFLNTSGTFASAAITAAGASPVALSSWDYDADGIFDLLTADNQSPAIGLLRNVADGTSFVRDSVTVSALPTSVWIGDLDGDALADFAASSGTGSATFFENVGSGAFAPLPIAAGLNPVAIEGGDWNGDGKMDLAILDRTSGEVRLLFNDEDLTTGAPIRDVTRPFVSAHPNPFVGSTQVHFGLPQEAMTRVDVYDVSGRHIVELHRGLLPSGRHQVTWNGVGSDRRVVPSGVYFLRVTSPASVLTQKVLRLR